MDVKTIRIKRRAAGWSQAELARRAKMHPTTISLIESGRLVPGEGQVKKIEAALLDEVGTDA